tara:strand:+ start:3726 stop:4856 length:1131 start_codon:yes stop_codon:yes gene_type:complete
MSFRYGSGIVKPGFNPLATQTTTYLYNLFTFGDNVNGPLGDGTTIARSSPVQIGSLYWLTAAAGYKFTAAVRSDNTMWTWGGQQFGRLGLNNLTAYSSPKQVGALTNWSKVSTSAYSCVAIKTDGTLWSWGYNNYGQLGHNDTVGRSSPVQVGALNTWTSLGNGFYSAMAIKTDGTLWAWGYNGNSQLGINNSIDKSSPTQVGSFTDWLSITASEYTYVGVRTNGTLYAWGGNQHGMLGDNSTTTPCETPKQVGALTTWASVGANLRTIYAITSAGALYGWGRNNTGQIGDNTTIYRSSPVQVGAATGWTSISRGQHGQHVFATRGNPGTLWSWGYNTSGQLGEDSTTNRSSPRQVGSVSSWLSPVTGYLNSRVLG